MVSEVFLLTKIKPEYSDILYNPTHFPGPLVCRITQFPLYVERDTCRHNKIKIMLTLKSYLSERVIVV